MPAVGPALKLNYGLPDFYDIIIYLFSCINSRGYYYLTHFPLRFKILCLIFTGVTGLVIIAGHHEMEKLTEPEEYVTLFWLSLPQLPFVLALSQHPSVLIFYHSIESTNQPTNQPNWHLIWQKLHPQMIQIKRIQLCFGHIQSKLPLVTGSGVFVVL